MTWQNIPGWTHTIDEFYPWLAKRLPKNGVFVEVGVFLGRSLAMMGELRPDLDLYAIDPWKDGESQGYTGPGEYTEYVEKRGGLFLAFLSSMQEHAPDVLRRTNVIRGTTATVRPVKADAVFIDGAHDYDSVCNDIAWARDCRASIISGHDYNPEWKPEDGKDDGRSGVITAVHEAFGKPNLMGTCWWVEK